jgi:tetratricopeptide (TPR) repeat protein
VETYPGDDVPLGNLGVIYLNLGDYDKALAATQEMMKVSPGSGLSYANLVSAYGQVNRLDEVRATAQEAQSHRWSHSLPGLFAWPSLFGSAPRQRSRGGISENRGSFRGPSDILPSMHWQN